MLNVRRITLLVGCLVLLGSIPGTSGCRVCDDTDCVDGFVLYLEPPVSVASGVRFELVIGNEAFSCELADGYSGTCDGSTGFSVALGGGVVSSIMATGLGHPTEVTLAINDGSETNTYVLDLEYETSHPNGEGCPPTCRSAYAHVQLE